MGWCRELILCEGYMDVIALHAAGFENAVATLGTAITSEQARLIAKYTKNVIISYDMDDAGRAAADKAMRLLAEVGVDVKVLRMSGAKDPDEYIKKFGADKFRQVIGKSQSGFNYKLDAILSKYDLELGEDKIKASAEICKMISAVYSSVERSVYVSAAAERLGISPDILKNDVERMRNSLVKQYRAKEGRDAQLSAKNIGDRINPDAAKNVKAAYAEEAILGLMLLFDEHRASVASGKTELAKQDFYTEFGARVFEAIMDLQNSEGGYSSAVMGERFNPDEMGRLQRMSQKRTELISNGSDVFESSVKALKEIKEKELSANDWMADIARRQKQLKTQKGEK